MHITHNLVLFILLLFPIFSSAIPYTPTHEQQVLEKLPRVIYQSGIKGEIKQLKKTLKQKADHWPAAKQLAGFYINQGQVHNDPRLIGYAQAILQPWWDTSAVPVEALLMRATIKQYEHNFDSALVDLNKILLIHPYHTEANLIKATITTILGEYETAKIHCRRLMRKDSLALAIACLSQPSSLSGNAETSYSLLRQFLKQAPGLSTTQHLWATTNLAEIAWRLGKFGAAEQHFSDALRINADHQHLLKTFSDFFLHQSKPQQVLQLLEGKQQNDSLLLRLAIAKKRLNQPGLQQDINSLQQRFDDNRKRGSSMHKGDEARFYLELVSRPELALQLAWQNWQIQKEPTDTYILIKAARAFNDKKTIPQIRQWLAKKGTKDSVIKQLLTGEHYEM